MSQLLAADLLVVGVEVLLNCCRASLPRNSEDNGFVVVLQLVLPVDVGEFVFKVFCDNDLAKLVRHAVVFVVTNEI